MSTFTIDQIARFREIERARMKRGAHGLYDTFKDLIAQLESGGADAVVSSDERVRQAKVLWDKGLGRKLKMTTFEEYLASIPEIPEKSSIEYLDRLVLVERRVTLVAACRLSGLKFSGNDRTFVPFDPNEVRASGVYWMWCQDGRRNLNKKPSVCRQEFQKGEIGCDVFDGVAIYAQDPTVINVLFLNLLGSVSAERRVSAACIGRWNVDPKLDWGWGDDAYPHYGSASRGE